MSAAGPPQGGAPDPRRIPLYPALQLRAGSLPIAEQLAAEVLSLPLWPQIGADAQARVADALLRTLRR